MWLDIWAVALREIPQRGGVQMDESQLTVGRLQRELKHRLRLESTGQSVFGPLSASKLFPAEWRLPYLLDLGVSSNSKG